MKKRIPLIFAGVLIGLGIAFPIAGAVCFVSTAMLATAGWLCMGAPADAPQETKA